MASKKIGLVLALDGEKEFRNAIKQCKQETQNLKNELTTLNAKYRDNQNSMEALTAKQEALTNKQEAYKTQLKTAMDALNNAKSNYNACADKLDRLAKELDEAKEKQEEMKKAGDTTSDAYQEQTKKIESLEKEIDDCSQKQEAARNSVNKWHKEVNTASNELNKCDKELQENEKYLDEAKKSSDGCATSIDKYGNEVEEAADKTGKLSISLGDMVKAKIIDMAGDALRNLGQKAIDAAKYVVEVGSSFEAQMSKVQAISGASAEEAERLAEKASEMGRTTKFTATEAGEALEYMAMAGWKTDDMLDGLEGIMNLAAAAGADLGTTSDIVTDALTAFGKSAADAGKLADIMAVASTNANTNVELMGETFKYAAPVAGALGYSMEDTAEAIGLMANAGIKGSQAGTDLRSIMTRLATNAGATKTSMGALEVLTEKLGVEFYNADGSARGLNDVLTDARAVWGNLSEEEQINYSKTIAGQRAMSSWLAIMNAGEGDISKLETALQNCDGAAQGMAETMQDNLQGKLTLFNSALEGLGVALYNYISGPLQGAVEFATNFINGITDAITPQKTVLESFIDDIDRTNKSIEKTIENANQTVENGKAKAAEISAYKDEFSGILDQCEQFNLITLENGERAIVDSSGRIVKDGIEPVGASAKTAEEILEEFAKGGFNTDGINESSEDAQEMIGYVEEKVDTVETRLSKFAENGIDTSKVEEGKTAIIDLFDDVGQKVGEVEAEISESGSVEIPTDSIDVGTQAIITCFDNTTGSVQSFKTSVENLQNGELNLETITSEFGKVEDSVKRTYHITDEFTKRKIDTMISNLGDAVSDLGDAWNSETGELTASKEELEKWFDTAKDVAMYSALQDAIQEYYDAWGQAAVNQVSANSAMTQALKEFNEEAGTTFKSYDEYLSWLDGDGKTAWYNSEEAISDAADAQKGANEEMSRAEEALNTTGEALKEYADKVKTSAEETDGQKEALEDADEVTQGIIDSVNALSEEEDDLAESTEELTDAQLEAIDAFREMFSVTDEGLEQMRENFESDAEFADWCKERVEETQKIVDAYNALVGTIESSMKAFVSGIDASGEEGSDAMDNIIQHMQEKNNQLEQWVADMKELGARAGAGFPQELYDSLLEDGPEKTYEAVHAMAEAAREGSEDFPLIAEENSRNLAITEDIEALAMCTSTGKAYGKAFTNGYKRTQGEYEKTVEESVKAGADAGKDATSEFSEVGESAGNEAASGIDSASGEVQQASEEMVDTAREAAAQIANRFTLVGQSVPQKFRQGIHDTISFAETASEEMISAARKVFSESMDEFKADGKEIAGNIKDGFDIESAEVSRAVKDLMREVGSEVKDSKYDFEDAGYSSSEAYTNAISRGEREAYNAARDLARNAFDAVDDWYDSWHTAGYNMSVGLANGIARGSSHAIDNAYWLAYNALRTAKNVLGINSPSKEFEEIGKYSDEGMAIGFARNQDLVEQAARESAQKAMKAAEAEMDGTSYYADLTGQINYAGMQKMNQIANMKIDTADTASAMRHLTDGMGALSSLAESLANPQAPNVTVMIGNREFKGYIVNTAAEGLGQKQKNLMKGVGG